MAGDGMGVMFLWIQSRGHGSGFGLVQLLSIWRATYELFCLLFPLNQLVNKIQREIHINADYKKTTDFKNVSNRNKYSLTPLPINFLN